MGASSCLQTSFYNRICKATLAACNLVPTSTPDFNPDIAGFLLPASTSLCLWPLLLLAPCTYLYVLVHAAQHVEPLGVRLDVAHGTVRVAHLLPQQALWRVGDSTVKGISLSSRW